MHTVVWCVHMCVYSVLDYYLYTPSNSPTGKEKAGSSSGSLGKETPGKIKVVVPITRYVVIHL